MPRPFSPPLRVALAAVLIAVLGVAAQAPRRVAMAALDCRSVPGNLVRDCGFESPVVGITNFLYTPASSAWTFDGGPGATSPGGSGIAGNGSPFTQSNPNAPQGQQVAFLQGRSGITQTISGVQPYRGYALTFDVAQRANQSIATRKQDMQVIFDNKILSSFTLTSNDYTEQGPIEFLSSASGRRQLVFRGLNSVGGDNTALIDNVRLVLLEVTPTPTPTPRPAPPTIALAPRALLTGGTLTVDVGATPRAPVRVVLQLVARGAVVYHAILHGSASAQGHFVAHVRIGYRPSTRVVAALTVTAQVPGAASRRAIALTITPPAPRPCALPCTVTVGPAPQAIAVDARTGHVFVVDGARDSVTMFDAATAALLRTSAAGSSPTALSLDATTERVFVANTGGSTISVLDARSGNVLRTVAVKPRPVAVAVAEAAGRVFVLSGNNRVSMLDARTGALLDTRAVGTNLSDLFALSVDTATGRVFLDDQGNNTVGVLDARTGRLLHTTPLRETPGTMASDARSGRVVVLSGGNHANILDGLTGRVLRTVAVGQTPQAVAVDAATEHAFVANAESGTVSVVDVRNGAALRTVAVGAQPDVVVVDTPAGRVYVAARGSSTISVLDAAAARVRGVQPAGGQPVALAVDAPLGRVFVLSGGATHGTLRVLRAG